MPGMPQAVGSKINLPQAVKLYYEKGYSIRDVANHFGVTKQAVSNRFKTFAKYLPDPEAIQAYRHNRVAVLDAVESVYVSDLIDPEKRQKASLNNVAYSFQQVHSARRLESGLSTENVNVIARLEGIERSLTESTSALELLEHELQARPQDVGDTP